MAVSWPNRLSLVETAFDLAATHLRGIPMPPALAGRSTREVYRNPWISVREDVVGCRTDAQPFTAL
jgi:hypothetical protein